MHSWVRVQIGERGADDLEQLIPSRSKHCGPTMRQCHSETPDTAKIQNQILNWIDKDVFNSNTKVKSIPLEYLNTKREIWLCRATDGILKLIEIISEFILTWNHLRYGKLNILSTMVTMFGGYKLSIVAANPFGDVYQIKLKTAWKSRGGDLTG